MSQVIALVDDDAQVRRSVGTLLRSVGLRVRTHGSAEDFLSSLQDGPGGAPDDAACLVLDLRLPGMSGLDLLHRLKADGWRPPVIVVSAHLDAANVRRCMNAGAAACLPKPFAADALIRSVSECVEGHEQP